MKPAFIIVFFIFCWQGVILAQGKSVGFSAPGSLGGVKNRDVIDSKETDLICTASYRENSGDEILSEGETATITILVRNYNKEKTIYPKLEITRLPNRLVRPTFKIVFLGNVRPGKMAAYKEVIPWHEEFSASTLYYTFKAHDARFGLVSEKMQVSFYVDKNKNENGN